MLRVSSIPKRSFFSNSRKFGVALQKLLSWFQAPGPISSRIGPSLADLEFGLLGHGPAVAPG